MKEFSLLGGQEQGESLNPPYNEGVFSFRGPGTEGKTFNFCIQVFNSSSEGGDGGKEGYRRWLVERGGGIFSIFSVENPVSFC